MLLSLEQSIGEDSLVEASIENDPNPRLPGAPEQQDDSKTSSTISYANSTRTKTVWDSATPPSVGSAIILSDMNAERYQKWTKQHQV